MSHFTRIKTQMVERAFLVQALRDLGHQVEEGDVHIRGWGGQRTRVEIKIPTKNRGYDIGFRKEGQVYEMVADWWGIRGIKRDQLLQQLTQRYAYQATRTKLAEQGFELVEEQQQKDGRLHLTLRRTVY
jgi:hypothetical protein